MTLFLLKPVNVTHYILVRPRNSTKYYDICFLLMIFFNWVKNEYANYTINIVDLYIGQGIKS